MTGNPSEFRVKLNRLLVGPRWPTALLSTRPTFTVTLFIYVLGSGLHVPRDVSIISRDTHLLLEAATPELTRYSSTALKLATCAARIAASLLPDQDRNPLGGAITWRLRQTGKASAPTIGVEHAGGKNWRY